MRRFFFKNTLIVDNSVVIGGDEARHIIRVLRLKPGDFIELFDGCGTVVKAKITQLQKNRLLVDIVEHLSKKNEEDSQIILGLGLLKGKKMDLVIQKATELGVHSITPLVTRYCEKRGRRRLQDERWRRIVLAACKQCRRSTLMAIRPLTSFSEFIGQPFDRKIVCYEREETTLLSDVITKKAGSVALLLGPEGGLSKVEIADAQAMGFQSVTLGDHILRAETAALAAISITGFLLQRRVSNS